MTTTTFHSKTFQTAGAPSVSDAFRQLMSALIAKLPSPAKADPAVSVTEEAEQVREMAYGYLATDPGFADDLFAAADRHELQHMSAVAKAQLQ